MVLIICTKNELNLTNRYWDMVPDGRTDGTDGRPQNYIPPTSSGDKNTTQQPLKWKWAGPIAKRGKFHFA